MRRTMQNTESENHKDDVSLGRRSWNRLAGVMALKMFVLLGVGMAVMLARPAWGQDTYASRTATQPAIDGAIIQPEQSADNLTPLLEAVRAFPALRSRISVDVEQEKLEKALLRVAAKADLRLSYGSEMVDGKRATLKQEQTTVYQAFQALLAPTELQIMVSPSGQLVLTDRSKVKRQERNSPRKATVSRVAAIAIADLKPVRVQTGTIAGTVTDAESGTSLPGVNVLVLGTNQGAATDSEGGYEISGIEPGTYDVQASFVGYQTRTIQDVTVQSDETTTVDIALQPSAIALDEVVAVGYGEQQRRDLTGSLAEVSTESVADVPVTRLDEMLQGNASGVQVIQGSGAPGSESTVRIRGTNSINAGSDPLVVIDGFPGAGDLNSINPSNIESIQVLKDASATAIYGARGSGGVILVTTKQGRVGERRVNFSASYSFQGASNQLDLLGAEEYAQLANEANQNAGQPPEFDNPSALGAGTDWQDVLFRTALRQEYQLSVSGGSEDVQYLVSGSYVDQEGIVRSSFFDRGHLRFNLDADISDRLRVGNNIAVSRVGQNQLGGRSVRNALLYRPTLGVRTGEGDYTQMQVPQLQLENPVAGVEEPRMDNTTFSGIGNIFAEYTILDGLEIRTSLGGEFRYLEDKEYIPTTLQEGRISGGQATVLTEKDIEWVSETTLNYSKTFADRHDIELLGGYTLQQEDIELVQTGATQFAVERLGFNNLSVGSVRSEPQTGVSESTLQSVIFRTNYRLSNKYLFTATGRYDGSSRFGEGNKYGFFPSGSVAWRLSEESFMDGADLVTDLKLRTSYGITGNQNIGTYAALARLAPTATVFGDEVSIGVEPTRVANPELKWEETSQLNIGMDATLADGRLSVTADYYRKVTSDLLLAVALPSQTGFASTVQNVGGVQNQGVELSVGLTSNLSAVTWSSDLNVTRNVNEVTDLGANEEIFPGTAVGGISSVNDQSIIIREGEPLGSFYGFVQEGLFQSQNEIDNSAQPNAEVGGPRYRDVNNDGVIDDADKQILGNGQADVYGSFANTFGYGGFQLRVQLRGSFGKDILNTSRLELESVNGAFNNLESVNDRWTPDNTDTNIPKATATGYPYVVTSRFVENGSYIRIQNVSLNYSIPPEWIGGLRNATVYLTGTNLYTFTDYSGYDPEINFQGGSNVAFSIDYNPYPRVRSYTLGVRLGL